MNKSNYDNVKEAKRLINLNEDSRHYFFEKADETWLEWLWKNGFFEVLKEKAKEPSRFTYRTPELRYLVRMADVNPTVVAEIILDIPLSEETFNPEVIDQFLHICSRLAGEYLIKLTNKISTENWPYLLRNYDDWPMDYGQMFESLEKSGHHANILELASAVLILRDDLDNISENSYIDDNPFYLKNLSYSKVFHYLSNIDENYLEDALDLALTILRKLITPSENDQERITTFPKKDKFPLYDVDVFTCGIRSKYHDSVQNDMKEVVALVKTLTERILNQQCEQKARIIYQQKFVSLPDSWLMWRIRLFVLTLCPIELMPYIKEAFFRIFKDDQYSDLIKGAEFKKALKIVFPMMDIGDQSEFISLAKALFSYDSFVDNTYSKKWDGKQVFSVIGEYLSEDQIAELVESGFEIDLEYIPTPMFIMGEGGFVVPKGPVPQEELHNIQINTIINNLKDCWSPSRLAEQDLERNFLNPLNADGMGTLIKDDVKTRVQEYLVHASKFLDPENIDLHYLFSLLSGLAVAIAENTEPLNKTDWDILINFCFQLVALSKKQPPELQVYESQAHNTWLGRWNAIHAEMITLLKKVLGENGKNLGFEWNTHRKNILTLIEYLFSYPDPTPEDEKITSAKMTVSAGNETPHVCDPYSMAINSIRGQAFELFALAIELDKEKVEDVGSNQLSGDIKRLYEGLLDKEKTRSLFFLFGHYLPMFYFRDKNWIKSRLHKIFPIDAEENYLYLAAWEGFLTNSLYLDMFKDEDIRTLYQKAIVLVDKDYPHQKHFTNPDEGIAQHFALAYVVSDFVFGNDLFEFFWKNGSLEQHSCFIDRIGRSFITTQNSQFITLVKEDESARRKIKEMWDWILGNCSDPSVFDGIGFWIDLEKEIFQADELAHFLAKTLVKTNGFLKWDVGLNKNIIELAKGSPENTVEIARLYLLEGSVRKELNSIHFLLDENWNEAFSILYAYTPTKQSTSSLINNLIAEGGSLFWKLKDILKSS